VIRPIIALLFSLYFLPALSAQAGYTATRRADIQVGVAASAYTLDYDEGREEGLTVYGDVDFTRHLGVEALYRNASIITPHDIGENHFLAGPRFRMKVGRFVPYAKLLIGAGTINFQTGYNARAYEQTYLDYAFGAGVDLHATRHINVRLFDLEFQRWPNFPPHGLTPWGASIGAAYRF
jgi:hypothetical protein